MASAATVAPSATASQKSSASANPTALDRASARYRAAQSRYRQAKAALKAIKRQIVPVDAFGNRKPRLRGWLHLATLPLCIAASIVLICIAPAGSVKAACAVYGASAMLLFGNSALLHVVPWRSAKVTRVLCGIDYSNIFLIIAGTNTPVAVRTPSARQHSPAISHGDLGDRGDRHDTAYRLAAHPELGRSPLCMLCWDWRR